MTKDKAKEMLDSLIKDGWSEVAAATRVVQCDLMAAIGEQFSRDFDEFLSKNRIGHEDASEGEVDE